MKKVIISSALVLTLLTTSSVPSFASGILTQHTNSQVIESLSIDGVEYKIEVLEDGKEVRKVKVSSENEEIIAVFWKKTGTVKLEKDGKVSWIIMSENNKKGKNTQKISTTATIIGKANDPIWGAYYKISKESDGTYYWDCGNGEGGVYLKQTSNNKAELYEFKGAIDGLVSKEAEFAAYVGTAAASYYAAIKSADGLSSAKIIAYLTSIGMGLSAAKVAVEIIANHANVELQYSDIS